MSKEEKTPPTDWEAKLKEAEAQREKERAEHLALIDWFTDITDQAILDSPQDFTTSIKASAFGRQAAKKADPQKLARLRELDLKYRTIV